MTTEPELKPCPMCGCDAEIVKLDLSFTVRCIDRTYCGCSVHDFCNKGLATAHWNKRAQLSEPDDSKECFAYLEEHGGDLSLLSGITVWPDGTRTNHCWRYSSRNIQVTAAKTAVDAIRQHMKYWKEKS